MTRYRLLHILFASTALAFASGCGDDEPDAQPTIDPSATAPTIVTLPPQATPTPLERIECDVDVPDITLETDEGSQAGLPIQMEWVGPDCTYGGPGHDFYYFPGDPLEIEGGTEPDLSISVEPGSLEVLVWRPNLQNAIEIASGETAVVMDSSNIGRRSSASPLEVSTAAEQTLAIADLEPGDYGIELFGMWPDGVAVYSLHVRVVEG